MRGVTALAGCNSSNSRVTREWTAPDGAICARGEDPVVGCAQRLDVASEQLDVPNVTRYCAPHVVLPHDIAATTA